MDPKVLKQLSLFPRDPILDFIARAYDKPNAVIEENLRWMVEKFAACQGEFFLLINREKDSLVRMACGGSAGLMPPHDFTYIKTSLYLGIVEGELRFGEAGNPFIFPIQTPLAAGDLVSKPYLQKGDVFEFEYLLGFEIMKYLKQPKETPDMDSPGLDIAIGDEEVKGLIRQYQDPLDKHYGEFPLLMPFYKMCILLGRYLQNFPEQSGYLEKHRDLFEKAHKEMGAK